MWLKDDPGPVYETLAHWRSGQEGANPFSTASSERAEAPWHCSHGMPYTAVQQRFYEAQKKTQRELLHLHSWAAWTAIITLVFFMAPSSGCSGSLI